MGIEECKLVELPVVPDPQGDLVFAEGARHVPFPIARVFFVYGVPEGAVRGGHAHLALEEAVFCLTGSLEVVVDDGSRRQTFMLEDPRAGLYMPPMVWHDVRGFSPSTAYVGFVSTQFDENDYIRDYDEYLNAVRAAEANG